MSFQAINWAYKAKTGSPSAKSVLVCLAQYANRECLCWPSITRLAADTELDERTVQRALRRLETIGLVSVTQRRRGRISQSSIYQINVVVASTDAVSGSQEGGGAVSPGVVAEIHPNSKIEHSVELKDSPIHAQFLEFWLAYPRKTGRAEAQIAFFKALTETDHQSILAGVARYTAVAGDDPEFIRYPARWLQWRGWEDGLDEAVMA